MEPSLASDIGTGLLHAGAYVIVAVLILGLGYVLTDLLTPGKLTSVILTERNGNATALAASNLAAAAIIVVTAIMVTRDDFGAGLLTTALFGLVGVAALAAVDLLVDVATPGKLHDILCAPAGPVARVQTTEDAEGVTSSGVLTPQSRNLRSLIATADHSHPSAVHPGVWFLSVAHIVVGAIIAASII